MGYFIKIVDYMGTALSWILTIFLVAIAIWGGSVEIHVNGIEKILKWW